VSLVRGELNTVRDQESGVRTPVPSRREHGFTRVLSLRDLVLFGLAFVGPTAPYSMFGIATVKSHGHLALVYLIAMLAMSVTAISYGRMAAAYPEAGSTYVYASGHVTRAWVSLPAGRWCSTTS